MSRERGTLTVPIAQLREMRLSHEVVRPKLQPVSRSRERESRLLRASCPISAEAHARCGIYFDGTIRQKSGQLMAVNPHSLEPALVRPPCRRDEVSEGVKGTVSWDLALGTRGDLGEGRAHPGGRGRASGARSPT